MEPPGDGSGGSTAGGSGLPTGRLAIDMIEGLVGFGGGRGGRGESIGLAMMAAAEAAAEAAVAGSLRGRAGGPAEDDFLAGNKLKLDRAGGGAGRALEKRDLPGVLGVLRETVSMPPAE